jgi:isopentenyl-diphosphate delta-isomerase
MMDFHLSDFEQRKRDHIQLALDQMHQTSQHNFFDDYELFHEAIPDMNFSDVDISVASFATTWNKPFFISSMTAGHEHAPTINANLLAACHEKGWAMGVGSQRRELMDKTSSDEWVPLRRDFPNVCMMANLGLAQVIATPIDTLKRLIDSLRAQAFIIHCNPLQEVIQPEGTPFFQGAWNAIELVVKQLNIPVVVKETGCGFSMKTIQRLNQLGVYAIDVSGMGGTHWGRIEGSRARHDAMLSRASQTFSNWGIPTASILADAKGVLLQSQLWGSGGIRNGLDAAKALVMGARRIGIAKPILAAALENPQAVINVMDVFEYELKVAMFCTGSPDIQTLSQLPIKVRV